MPFKKILAPILAAAVLFSLAACGADPSPAPAETMAAETYTVTVKTAGGMALPGIDVYI